VAAKSWKIEIRPTARLDLQRLRNDEGDDAHDEVILDILDLREDPFPDGYQHLRKTKDLYRIYTYRSLYRIVYQVLFEQQKVQIIRVRPRGIVYSGYDRW
jgi:mRNA-degrading endonuclease RelE of RelBE toxin-antitoxin system